MSTVAPPMISTTTSLDTLGVNAFEALCQEPASRNVEIFKPNHFYGIAPTLKRYANYSQDKPLKGVLQHGYDFLSEDFLFGGEFEAFLPMFFPPNEKRAAFYREISNGKPAVAIGAPFLYAKKLIDAAVPDVSRRAGTIVFPAHSTRLIDVAFDHEQYADKLAALPDEFKPIAISIYWRDYQQGSHIPYQRRGFEILTAGHMFDPEFMNRVYLNCRKFKYACSNEYGSSVFFSIASGCQFFHYDSEAITYQTENPAKLVVESISETQKKNFERLFTYPSIASFDEQSFFALTHLGESYLKSPSELRKLFQWAELLDRFYFTPVAQKNKGNYPDWFLRVPPYWRRMKKTRKLLDSVMKRLAAKP